MNNAHDEGKRAYLEGLELRDCPYPEDSEKAVEWEGGWIEQEENQDD